MLEIKEIEYETIALESDESVTFRINGTEIEIERDTLVDFDLEGRLYLDRSDAERLGLI